VRGHITSDPRSGRGFLRDPEVSIQRLEREQRQPDDVIALLIVITQDDDAQS